MFAWAPIGPDDKEKILQVGGFIVKLHHAGHRFLLPCNHHQNGRCDIYHSWRPEICRTHKCKLLRRFLKGDLSFNQATIIIQETINHVNRIREQLSDTGIGTGNNLSKRFKEWQKTQGDSGEMDWRKRNQTFILDYIALGWRLNRYFRNKKKTDKPTIQLELHEHSNN
jgi:hypothetical protein